MSKSRSMLGIAVLFALALGAFSAASASAKGATAFTCVENLSGALFGPHCLKTSTGNTIKYTHVAFSETTLAGATNANTASGTVGVQSSILRSTLAGVNTEVRCTLVAGEGLLKNVELGEEMFAHVEGTLTYSGCTVKAPAEKGCKVQGGGITTKPLTGRTVGEGATVQFVPINFENKFTTITIEGCSIAALNNPFPVTGSLEVKTNGATLTSTHAEVTAQNRLKFGGQKAGLDGALTLNVGSTAISVTATP